MSWETYNIPLSEFEEQSIQKTKRREWIARLPIFVLKYIATSNLDDYRKPKAIAPIIQEPSHDLLYERIEIAGDPKPVGISIYYRKEDKDKPLPLLLFIHGGGYIGGSSKTNEGLMRYMADKLGIIAASVDYNLSPEAKFPVPLADCQRALEHLIKKYPIREDRVFISGDSAGGNLAAALVLKLQDEKRLKAKGQILLYPILDLDKLSGESYKEKGLEYKMMYKIIGLSRSIYVPDRKSRKNPYVTPLYAPMSEIQPDALLLVAERDGLRSDALNYAKKLEENLAYLKVILYKGAFHAFIDNLFRSRIADHAAQEMIEFIQFRIMEDEFTLASFEAPREEEYRLNA